MPVAFPPVPIVSFDEKQVKHPVVFKLDQVFLPFGSAITQNSELKGEKDVTTTVLARTTSSGAAGSP